MDTRTVLTLTLSGDVSDYTPAVRTELKMTFAEVAGVLPEQVLVTIEAGSVVVGVEIESPAGAAPTVLARLQNASRTPAALTEILRSRVQGITISVESIGSLASEPLWSPPAPPTSAGASAVETSGSINILVTAVLAAIVGLLCCLAMVCWWTRRRQVELRRKDVNHGLRSMSVRRASVDPLHQHQAHAGGSVAVAEASIPRGHGGGGGGGGVEMSGRFDRHSSRAEGPSHADGPKNGARPAMAGVIGTSGSSTISGASHI